MIDIKRIRKEREVVEKLLQRKDPTISLDRIIEMDLSIRQKKTEVESLKAERNELSKRIGEKKQKGEESAELTERASAHADQIHRLDEQVTLLEKELESLLSYLPNIPDPTIPVSQNPKDNVCLKEWGKKPSFSFAFKNHVELNETLHLFDFKRGAKLTGAGWPVYRGLGARLEWALLQYMVQVHIRNGFEQWMVPLTVRQETLYGSGQLPKFANQQFMVKDDHIPLCLIPTAEIPLNGLHAEEILPRDVLPLRYFAYTPCFRREAGAAGSQERGLIRTHQFNKVEMFVFCTPEASEMLLEQMVASAEHILQGLELHYRNMLLVTGDMSFAGTKTIDVEVWLPGQDRYYEVSSITNCSDYQARRSATRFRPTVDAKPEFVHTLNGSGLATSRLMVALLENNQQPDGSITIPKVLRPYLDGLEKISPQTVKDG